MKFAGVENDKTRKSRNSPCIPNASPIPMELSIPMYLLDRSHVTSKLMQFVWRLPGYGWSHDCFLRESKISKFTMYCQHFTDTKGTFIVYSPPQLDNAAGILIVVVHIHSSKSSISTILKQRDCGRNHAFNRRAPAPSLTVFDYPSFSFGSCFKDQYGQGLQWDCRSNHASSHGDCSASTPSLIVF